jgi:hypothetical protein
MKSNAQPAYGLLAEFDSPQALLTAAEATYAQGYRAIDAYSPFPIHGLAEAIGFRRTGVPLVALIGGLVGGIGGFGLQYWCMAIDYPLNIGGRPLNSWPMFIPVTFEMTILGAALSTVIGMFVLNRLPMPYHAVFNVDRFAMASRDRFFLCIESRDPKFDAEQTKQFLASLAAKSVVEVPP